jgi:peptidyl-prolyl cis-trans isomerase SurA
MYHPGPASRRRYSRLFAAAIALAAASAITACRSKPAASAAAVSADTWAVVDGQSITREDVDKAYRRSRDGSQPLSDEETLTAKLSLLDDLVVQQILLGKARTLTLDVPQTDLDSAFANAKKNITDEAFQQELAQRGLTAADMREGLRRDLLIGKVFEREVASKVAVTDREVSDYFNANKPQFNFPEEAYHLAQIVITPVRDAQIANRTGDDAATPEAAMAKVRMLMEQLKSGTSFRDLAIGYSEDPESAPRGGDLGLVPVSKLKQAPPQLRDAVLNKAAGSVNVASAGGAYTLVLVVAHEQAGQRDLSTPGVRERISETLRARKEQLLRAAYLAAARNDATVVNYLARRLVDSKGAMPSLLPAPPRQP